MSKFTPLKGQCYYTPSFASPTLATMLVWSGDASDYIRLEHGLVFKTIPQCIKATQSLMDYHLLLIES
mgnify:CR=1 FL=1